MDEARDSVGQAKTERYKEQSRAYTWLLLSHLAVSGEKGFSCLNRIMYNSEPEHWGKTDTIKSV